VTVLIGIALTLVLAGGAAVVFSSDPQRQAVTLSVYGLLLTVLFMLLAAPDVALSQVVVGTAIIPLMVMLTIRKVRGHR
jgi:energy-converting hydrogenase B subunit D